MRGKELRHAIALEEELHQRMDTERDVAAARDGVRELLIERTRKSVPDDIRVQPVDEPGVRGEWVASPLDAEQRIVLYAHGGAWTFGSPEQSRELAARICHSSHTRVLSVAYRLAPEHLFPAALDDVVAAFRCLVDQGADPRQIALAGESTGGTLALGAALRLRDADGAVPGAVAVMSPVTDLTAGGDAPGGDPLKAWPTIQRYADAYLGDTPKDDPRVSPLFADLAGLPALLLQAGTADPVLEQSRRFAARADAAGVDVTFHEWDGMVHRWHSFPHIYDSGRATNQVGDFLLQRIGPGYVPVER